MATRMLWPNYNNTALTGGATGTLGVTGASTGGTRTEQCKHKVRCVHELRCELRNWGVGCAIDFASSEDAVARCTEYAVGCCCCAMHGCCRELCIRRVVVSCYRQASSKCDNGARRGKSCLDRRCMIPQEERPPCEWIGPRGARPPCEWVDLRMRECDRSSVSV